MKLKEMRAETLTLVLVNLAGIMESADESLLPGVYKEVGADLHIGPTGLGFLTLFRSMVQASCYPIAVYLSVRHNRAHVIALGTFLWAAATFLVAFSSTFLERNGAYRPIPGRITATPSHHNSLRYRDRYRDFEPCAIVTPAIESLVADSTDDSNRGMAFGWLQFTREIGSIIGGVSSVLLASTSTSFMGIPGWRIAFHLVGIISVIVGILVGRFAQDPHFSYSDEAKTQKPKKVKDLFKEAKSVLKIPSFQIIVAQGVSGSFPGKALSFGPMWLELIGFSHKTTALLWTLFVMAYAVGGLFGGKMGDILAQRLPNAGRIINSGTDKLWFYYSVSSDSAAVQYLQRLLPRDLERPSMLWIVSLSPYYTSVICSPTVVGILAEHVYGYKPIQKGETNSQEIETDRENAKSLAKALYTSIGIPMAICCIIFSFLYFTLSERQRSCKNACFDRVRNGRNRDGEFEFSFRRRILSTSC